MAMIGNPSASDAQVYLPAHPRRIEAGGCQKGTPNATTHDLRDAILRAFQAAGGAAYLQKIAETDPRTFCTLLTKVPPTKMEGNAEYSVHTATTVNMVIVDPQKGTEEPFPDHATVHGRT